MLCSFHQLSRLRDRFAWRSLQVRARYTKWPALVVSTSAAFLLVTLVLIISSERHAANRTARPRWDCCGWDSGGWRVPLDRCGFGKCERDPGGANHSSVPLGNADTHHVPPCGDGWRQVAGTPPRLFRPWNLRSRATSHRAIVPRPSRALGLGTRLRRRPELLERPNQFCLPQDDICETPRDQHWPETAMMSASAPDSVESDAKIC